MVSCELSEWEFAPSRQEDRPYGTETIVSTAWAASLRVYDPRDSDARVAQVIGGNVAKNINNPDDQAWNNTCAVRMSYILDECGVLIPFKSTQTVSGADKRWYFLRVKDVIAFLKKQWGAPDSVIKYPPAGGGPLAGKNGVIPVRGLGLE